MPNDARDLVPDNWPQELQLAPPPPIDPHPSLTPAGRQVIHGFVANINDYVLECRRRYGRESWATNLKLLTGKDADYLCDAVVDLSYNNGEFWTPIEHSHISLEDLSLPSDGDSLEPIQLVRLLVASGQITERGVGLAAQRALTAYRQAGRALGLRELGTVFQVVGVDPRVIASDYLLGWQQAFRWGPSATWPFFVEHLEALSLGLIGKCQRPIHGPMAVTLAGRADISEIEVVAGPWYQSSSFDALDCFPRVPPPLLDQLYEIALGSAKAFRARAQRVLTKEPQCFSRILNSVESKKSAIRGIAARWLGDLERPDAVEPLQDVLRKEKHDSARDAMMDALARLGVPPEGILDRRQLAIEAARKLAARKLPQDLAWIPVDQLPRLKWRGTQEEVPTDLTTWWLLHAYKMKSPEPGFQLRCQLELVEPADREAFSEALLQAWIDFDTMPPTMEQARAAAGRFLERAGRVDAATYEELGYAIPQKSELLAHYLNQSGGSAIRYKGLLAVCAACGGEATAAKAGQFIRRWYGVRAAQSKALVRMISWIEHPAAVQFLTATAKRFRTRGVRAEAHKAILALAERKGWTVEEFADRMIPDGGLDEEGRMWLDFGSRQFVVELDPGLRLQVRAEDGTLRRDLPKPGKHDDEAKAVEARRAYSKAKKQIREVVKEQTDRLYVAMCSERRWEFGVWRDTLARHPIVGILCRRVVWRAGDAERGRLFRPRGDPIWSTLRARPLERLRMVHRSRSHTTTIRPRSRLSPGLSTCRRMQSSRCFHSSIEGFQS